ncbi:6-phosphogluconolactonase [bacterium]|nr:6-phosphogluconolactonase [bacterium]
MIQDRVIDQYPGFPANAVFAQALLLKDYTKEKGLSLEKGVLASDSEYVDWKRVHLFLGDIILDTLEEDREEWEFSKMESHFWDMESYYKKCEEVAFEFNDNLKLIRFKEYLLITIIPETSDHEEKLVNRLGELGLSEIIMVDEPTLMDETY